MAIQYAICPPDVPFVAFSQRWLRPVCPSLCFHNAGFSIFLEKFLSQVKTISFPCMTMVEASFNDFRDGQYLRA